MKVSNSGTSQISFYLGNQHVTIIPNSYILISNNFIKEMDAILDSYPSLSVDFDDVLFVQTSDVTVANTVTESSIIGAGIESPSILANSLKVGNHIKLIVRGFFSETNNPDLTFNVYLNNTLLVTSDNFSLSGSHTNRFFGLDVDIICRSVGATGTILAQGRVAYDNNATTGNIVGLVSMVPVTIDTTINQIVDVKIMWGAANPANTLTSNISLLKLNGLYDI